MVQNVTYLFITARYVIALPTEAKVKEGYSAFYVINVVFQSIFTLAWQIAAAVFVGWLFVGYVGAPRWIYVPLILAGVASGLVSMVRFILAAMSSLDRIEGQRQRKRRSEDMKNGK